MGDINFNIAKDVNLNKQVQMDINKNVDVNVNNPDQLATAEADAEAFGPNALAEVDAYTLVTPPTMTGEEAFEDSGAIDAVGNTTDFGLEGSVEIVGGDGDLPEDITIDLTSDGSITPGLPDVDDLNASGSLASLNNPFTTPDNQLPNDNLSFSNDLNLSFVQEVALTNPATAEGEYSLDDPIVVSFGNQDLDLNGDGNSAEGELSLTIPSETTFLVEELGAGEFELEFASAPDGNPILWSHDDLEGDLAPDSPIDTPFEVTAFVQDAEDAGIGFADWAFQAGIFDRIEGIPGEGGTAFAYAESTSALDLNPNAGDDLVV